VPVEMHRDPREVLARDKYFSLRPQPLEQWLWRQGVPPSAERVFWLHWQEGMRNRDWCSCIALKHVASQCSLDVSSVTRAYQVLGQLGLVRRQDPGRDPARPFQQAIAVTEVCVPRELLQELDRYPNRTPREVKPSVSEPAASPPEGTAVHSSSAAAPALVDPFAGLSARERRRALGDLRDRMSPAERCQYDESLRTHRTHLTFDPDSSLRAEERGTVLQLLALAARKPIAPPPRPVTPLSSEQSGPRRLSVFELARLRRELQALSSSPDVDELLRQVVWSVEEGALRRFTSLHAVRIALKKIREGAWTRPHRMPPKWARALASPPPVTARQPAAAELCGTA
jgi:hypothetical protein